MKKQNFDVITKAAERTREELDRLEVRADHLRAEPNETYEIKLEAP